MNSVKNFPLIDTHCHLDYDYAPKGEADLIREARDAGITTLISVGTEMARLPRLQEISESHEGVFHTVGVHPHEAITFRADDVETLRAAARHPKCLAIGEIGLDYHYDHSPPEIQRQVLEQQLKLALEAGLPVVIHSREAEEDLLPALSRYADQKSKSGGSIGVIHCFTGTRAFGEACIRLGFHISFSGILTFKNAEDLRECARAFPLSHLLVETDSPYLAPVPFRGKKCEPSMVRLTAQKLAEIKGISFEDVAQTTTENARKLFNLT